tara:strand:- start:1101 stop:1364 length:264 start_codon:yes stop_codon:yes gene_type:complete
MEKKSDVLLPPYPPTTPLVVLDLGGFIEVIASFETIHDILRELWDECEHYEFKYSETRDPIWLMQINMTVHKIQYWQNIGYGISYCD